MSESIHFTPEERQEIISEIIANLDKLGFVEHETESMEVDHHE
jgi:hypothetical protein